MAESHNDSLRRRGNAMMANGQPDSELPHETSDRLNPNFGTRNLFRTSSNIRIRRLPSNSTIPTVERPSSRQSVGSGDFEVIPEAHDDSAIAGRRRSSSAPQRYGANLHPPMSELSRTRSPDPATYMQTITEGTATTAGASDPRSTTPGVHDFASPATSPSRNAQISPSALEAGPREPPSKGIRRPRSTTLDAVRHDEYGSDVVDLLDLIDPEVRTLGTLTNVQNSLFIPDLGGLINRRPTYELSPRPTTADVVTRARSRAGTRVSLRRPPPKERLRPVSGSSQADLDDEIELQPPRRTMSISSRMSESRYAVLPHGISLDDWTDEDIEELNDHVRHLLHSRREGFKRNWKGFKKYVSQPLGLFVFVYALLVTLFGAAWVFCLIGWIYVGSRQDYFIDVVDNVLVALFALIGDGLAPFRAVDTYHMCFIAHYHHLTWRLRKEKALPNLADENDLPERRLSVGEIADAVDKTELAELSVLSQRQQARLQYHQAKFSKAHTFYRPHETATHHAFPLRYLVAVVVLLDCHSLFQVALGTCTWSINYRVRPQALTATILSLSISCNIAAGIVISMGDRRTRKKDVLERIFRQGLTEEAIRSMQKRRTDDMRVSLDLSAMRKEAEDGSAPPLKPAKLVYTDSSEGKDAMARARAMRQSSEQ